jgi:hypothetical protein
MPTVTGGAYDADPKNLRQFRLRMLAEAKRERSSWDTHWRELGQFLQPRATRFTASDRNKGNKKHQNIVDNTGTRAVRALSAGLMSGVTSPSRPWFRLGVPDKALSEEGPVRMWLDDVETIMRRIFAASNTYRTLHGLYEELGIFGTGVSFVEDNFENVIHHNQLMVGEYCLNTDDNSNVDGLIREFEMTVDQTVRKFGIDKVSPTVKNLYDNGNLLAAVEVVHMVHRREHRDVRKLDSGNMPYCSVYFEPGRNDAGKPGTNLREGGYNSFRVLAPRWVVRGNDVYGESPGMDALGDVKQLQHQQLRKGQAIDYSVDPPLQVPLSYKSALSSRLPGGLMFVDSTADQGGIRSAYEANLRLDFLLADVKDVRDRIDSAFFKDLFLMIASDTRSNITATEIAERHEEKLLQLGPVLERVHNELLSPLIDIAFDAMVRAKIVPPPPPELEGVELEVEYISILAQAQKAVGSRSLDKLLQVTANLAALNPEVLDKIDFDQVVDEYGNMYAISPKVIRSDEDTAALREQRQQAEAQAQQAAAMPMVAETAKTLGETDPAQAQKSLAAVQAAMGQ